MTNQPQRNICDTAPESLPYFGHPESNRSVLLDIAWNLLARTVREFIEEHGYGRAGIDFSLGYEFLIIKIQAEQRNLLAEEWQDFCEVMDIDQELRGVILEAIDIEAARKRLKRPRLKQFLEIVLRD